MAPHCSAVAALHEESDGAPLWSTSRQTREMLHSRTKAKTNCNRTAEIMACLSENALKLYGYFRPRGVAPHRRIGSLLTVCTFARASLCTLRRSCANWRAI